jgi:hypothetical protein
LWSGSTEAWVGQCRIICGSPRCGIGDPRRIRIRRRTSPRCGRKWTCS